MSTCEKIINLSWKDRECDLFFSFFEISICQDDTYRMVSWALSRCSHRDDEYITNRTRFNARIIKKYAHFPLSCIDGDVKTQVKSISGVETNFWTVWSRVGKSYFWISHVTDISSEIFSRFS